MHVFSKPSLGAFALGFALGAHAAEGPCDIYKAGGTPCVAAHSTVRALYDSYTDALYQIQRGSDDATTDVTPLPNGVANITIQDSFCAGTTCLISIIYDQSNTGNHLYQATPGSADSKPENGSKDYLASAIGAPVTVNGTKAYGVFIPPKTGYRNDKTKKISTGDDPEGMYALLDGTHMNHFCCFDYGNAETDNTDHGGSDNGAMEAIYFGIGGYQGSGNGPWVQADLENGMFSGSGRSKNEDNHSMPDKFVTAIVKGDKGNHWAIRAGNASEGALETMYDGKRHDSSYSPMKKQGAIVLGVGGDNSDRGQGTFYEGAMTSSYPSDDTENKVQANIVAANYGTTSLISDKWTFHIGQSIYLRATTDCCTTRYITHSDEDVKTQVVSSSSSDDLKKQASFVVHTGLGSKDCFSFESWDQPGSWLRHSSYQLKVDKPPTKEATDIQQFNEDATFCPQTGINGDGHFSIRSWSYPTRYWRHFNNDLYIAGNGGPHDFDSKTSFNDDASWEITQGFS
jgi:hypothetical protein